MNWKLLAPLLLLSSCSATPTRTKVDTITVYKDAEGNKIKAPGENSELNPGPGVSDPKKEDEGANRPEVISGVYLRCSTLLDATAELPTSQVACRLNNKDGLRVDPASIGVKAAFNLATIPATVKVTQRVLNFADRSYDSLFDISASNVAAVLDAIDKITPTVELRGIIGDESFGSQSSTYAQAKIEPIRADWISYLYGSSPTYVDQSTSLVWALDDGKGYTLEEGRVHCEDLIYADSGNWRLPTIVELRTAQLNGLGVAYADGGNMNIDSKRFGGYGSSTLEFPDLPPVIGTSRRWSIDLGAPSATNASLGPVEDRKSVICVHESGI